MLPSWSYLYSSSSTVSTTESSIFPISILAPFSTGFPAALIAALPIAILPYIALLTALVDVLNSPPSVLVSIPPATPPNADPKKDINPLPKGSYIFVDVLSLDTFMVLILPSTASIRIFSY